METHDYYNLMARYFAGEATAAEQATLEKWLDESPQRRQLFTEAETVWKAGISGKLVDVSHIKEDWQALRNRLKLGVPSSRRPRLRLSNSRTDVEKSRYWQWHKIAAVMAILLLLSIGILFLKTQHPQKRLVTHNAQKQEVILPDGSLVQLNHASELIFAKTFTDSARMVWLRGEAFFKVVSAEKPFVVQTENAQIRVLGTQFNIWSRAQQTRVIVTEGRVAFQALNSSKDEQVALERDQMSVCARENLPEPPKLVDSGHLLGWLQGRIVFEKTPLAEIVAELNRHYDVPIVLTNTAMNDQTLTGTFHNKPLDFVLSSICTVLDLQYTKSGKKYLIFK